MDNKNPKNPVPPQKEENPREQPQRSGAFNEKSTKDQKSTRNVEEEAVKEQTKDKGEKTMGNMQ